MNFKFFSLWKIIVFSQPIETLQKFNRSIMGLTPLQDSNILALSDRLENTIQSLISSDRCTLIDVVLRTFRRQLIYYITVVQVCVCVKIYVSYLLGCTIASLSDRDNIMVNASLLCLFLIIQVLLEQHYFQNVYQFSMRLRLSIVGLVYHRMIGKNSVEKGKLFNIISMDLMELDLTWLIALSGSIVVACAGSGLLIMNWGVSSLFGLSALAGINHLQHSIVKRQTYYKEAKNKAQDQRTKLVGEVLNHLRTLKMFASEHVYRNEIVELRSQQDGYSIKALRLDAVSQLLAGNISVFLAMLITITTYVYAFNGVPEADKIFSSLWVFQLMKVWCCTYFYRGRKFWVNMKILDTRVSEIIAPQQSMQLSQNKKKGQYKLAEEEETPISIEDNRASYSLKTSINFEEYNGQWKEGIVNLQNISLRLQLDSEKVGSSKSSLMMAILGEIPHSTGSIEVNGSLAYVEQSPFLFPGTIRSNILFGLPYEQERYQQCISYSCLQEDLVERSDLSEIGDRGCMLSGGQRARVSLARAIYSNAEILLLDDVMAAVDTKVASKIFNNGIMNLRNQGKMIILVTHQMQWALQSDRVIFMEQGRISKEVIGDEINKLQEEIVVKQKIVNQEEAIIQDKNKNRNQSKLAEIINKTQLYKQYIHEAGGNRVLVLMGAVYLMDATINMLITKQWGQWAESQDHQQYIQRILVMATLFGITQFLKLNLVYRLTFTAIQNMHRKLATSVTRAKVSALTNVGSMLARFTTDLNNIEGLVMLDTHWVMEGCTDNLFVVAVVATTNPIALVGSVCILMGMMKAKSLFAPQMKYAVECDDKSRGRLLNFLEASTEGALLIRTYGQRAHFEAQLLELCYGNMQSYFTFLRLNGTLGFLYDMSLHTLIIVILVSMIYLDSGDASEIGFGVLMLLNLGYIFSLNLRAQIFLEIDMQNVQRVQKSIEIDQEEASEAMFDYKIEGKWPLQGEVEFKNVSLSYEQLRDGIIQRQYALKNISFVVDKGISIGIVGRTGAGKSSIINTLFRLIELDSGCITIDGVDIDSVGLHTLRQAILVIPQNTPLISVSLRKNIDPINKFSDDRIWECIRMVNLYDKISAFSEKLDTILSQEMFSAGERQLFCIIRILLPTSPTLIVVDEATANMDDETDTFIQQLIVNQFRNVNKIIIAHRLTSIIQCDRVMVMDQGEIVEFDTPKALMNSSVHNGFRSMVNAMEKSMRQELINKLESI